MEAYRPYTISYAYHALTILVSLLFLSNFHTTLASTPSTTTENYKTYIKTACHSTTYPTEYNNDLLPFASKIEANPQKLCKSALSVSLKAAKNCSSTISKLSKNQGLTKSEVAIIKDCIVNVKDSIDQLNQSLSAMEKLGSSNVKAQIDNIKTWVSAALTDETTCTDGFAGMTVSNTVKNTISNSILSVSKRISNALALINRFYPN
ncbi:pectinesterase inhibitor 4-like [Castanea sativa]|uniref:pectinesterase inhibitor 4-like n=1 Tax=Castanea sativa TaxID=21020 RepID=UPI003F653BB4